MNEECTLLVIEHVYQSLDFAKLDSTAFGDSFLFHDIKNLLEHPTQGMSGFAIYIYIYIEREREREKERMCTCDTNVCIIKSKYDICGCVVR